MVTEQLFKRIDELEAQLTAANAESERVKAAARVCCLALGSVLLAMGEYAMDVDCEPPQSHRELMQEGRAAHAKMAEVLGVNAT